jgi:hypothetical protein
MQQQNRRRILGTGFAVEDAQSVDRDRAIGVLFEDFGGAL